MFNANQFEVTIILPTTYATQSQGTIDQTETCNAIVDDIIRVTGGVSVVNQNGVELWDDGSRYADPALRVYTTTRNESDVNELRNIAIDAIDALHQRGGVFFQVHPVFTEWLSRDDVRVEAEETVRSQASFLDTVEEAVA